VISFPFPETKALLRRASRARCLAKTRSPLARSRRVDSRRSPRVTINLCTRQPQARILTISSLISTRALIPRPNDVAGPSVDSSRGIRDVGILRKTSAATIFRGNDLRPAAGAKRKARPAFCTTGSIDQILEALLRAGRADD